MNKILVTGSAGFIGNHLVKKLQDKGCYVVGVDVVDEKYNHADVFYKMDLRNQNVADFIIGKHRVDKVYNLACLMGGMGYISDGSKAYDIIVGSSQIISNVIWASKKYGVKKHFYSSSACVYNMTKQETIDCASLKESDCYPAMPDLTYGWQKIFGEQMYQAIQKAHGTDIRIARFHNIFGIEGVWDGGKEKYPAAICRKVAQAKDGDTIIIWGDGLQTRSYLNVDECLNCVFRLMESNVNIPLNIGSDEMISCNDLAKMVIEISGKDLKIEHDLTKPQGVRGRNSDNTLIKEKLGYAPQQDLRKEMVRLYNWINQQVNGDI